MTAVKDCFDNYVSVDDFVICNIGNMHYVKQVKEVNAKSIKIKMELFDYRKDVLSPATFDTKLGLKTIHQNKFFKTDVKTWENYMKRVYSGIQNGSRVTKLLVPEYKKFDKGAWVVVPAHIIE